MNKKEEPASGAARGFPGFEDRTFADDRHLNISPDNGSQDVRAASSANTKIFGRYIAAQSKALRLPGTPEVSGDMTRKE